MSLVNYLSAIPDPRRAQSKQYELGFLLLFCILSILTGATSYRKIQRFMAIHRETLNTFCGIDWKRAPAHTSIRYALHRLEATEVEAAFRAHAHALASDDTESRTIALDGKVLKGSVDHFNDRKAIQVLSAFSTDEKLILGHIWMTDEESKKAHEIPAARQLIKELGLSAQLFTLDALHTQKNGHSSG